MRTQTLTVVTIVSCLIFIPNFAFTQQSDEIPSWVKNNAGWWSQGKIDDFEFISGVQYLIKEGIIKVPPSELDKVSQGSDIPEWIKNNAKWWAEDKIEDNTFVSGIQFLIKQGIITISLPNDSDISLMDIKETFEADNKSEYEKMILMKLKDNLKQDSVSLIDEIDNIVKTGNDFGYDGLGPLIVEYTFEISKRNDFESNLYNNVKSRLQETLDSKICDSVIEEWLKTLGRGGDFFDHRPDQRISHHSTIEFLDLCMATIKPPTVELDLRDGMILPELTANSNSFKRIHLKPPNTNLPLISDSSDIGFSATLIGELPEGHLHFLPLPQEGMLEIRGYGFSGTSEDVYKWARSKTFTIQMSQCLNIHDQSVSCTSQESTNKVDYDYEVTMPVKLGIHPQTPSGSLSLVLIPGQPVNITVYASGEEIHTGGPMNWSLKPSSLDLPLGLSMNVDANGNLVITGIVEEGAYSSSGTLQLQQGDKLTEHHFSFDIPVYFLQDDYTRIVFQTYDLGIGEHVQIELPQTMGGDGTNYMWDVESNHSLFTTIGLQLVKNNDKWFIEGTVSQGAPIGEGTITLQVSSSSNPSRTKTIPFNINVYAPFNVWTQNLYILCNNNCDGEYDHARMMLVEGKMYRDPTFRPDIIAFQESWSDRSDDFFEQQNRRGVYYATPSFGGGEFHPDSGLVTLFKNEMTGDLQHHVKVFDNTEAGPDKGFTLDKVQIGNHPDAFIYVLNTHLTSGDNCLVDAVNDEGQLTGDRGNQLREIRNIISKRTVSSHPVLLLGDFNISDNIPRCSYPNHDYEFITKTLDPIDDLYRIKHPDERGYTFMRFLNLLAYDHSLNEQDGRFDYMFVRQGTHYKIDTNDNAFDIWIIGDEQHEETNFSECERIRDERRLGNKLICYFSDHFGLQANLRLVKNQ